MKNYMNTSDNATALGMSTNQTFEVMAGEINSPMGDSTGMESLEAVV